MQICVQKPTNILMSMSTIDAFSFNVWALKYEMFLLFFFYVHCTIQADPWFHVRGMQQYISLHNGKGHKIFLIHNVFAGFPRKWEKSGNSVYTFHGWEKSLNFTEIVKIWEKIGNFIAGEGSFVGPNLFDY